MDVRVEIAQIVDGQCRIGQQPRGRRAGRRGGRRCTLRRDDIGIVADERRHIDDVQRPRRQFGRHVGARFDVGHGELARQVAVAERPGHPGEPVVRSRLHQLRVQRVRPRLRNHDADNPKQFGQVAPRRLHLQRHVLDIRDGRQRARDVYPVVRGIGGQRQFVLAAGHRRIGRQQLGAQREGGGSYDPLAGQSDGMPDPGVRRPDVVDLQIRQQLQPRIEIAYRRAGHGRAVDQREVERLAALLVVERPAVGGVRRVPFQIDRAVGQVQPVEPPLAEDQRPGGDSRVDPVRRKQHRLGRPGRVRDAQPLGIEFDRDRIEIQLEIARNADRTVGQRADDAFERVLQEPPLGDVQHQPTCEDNQQQAAQHPPHGPPAAARGWWINGIAGGDGIAAGRDAGIGVWGRRNLFVGRR